VASLKLKVEAREKLYYGKYAYKAVSRIKGAYYIYNVTTLQEYKEKIQRVLNSEFRFPTYTHGKLYEGDYRNINKLLKFIAQFQKNESGAIRREGNNITFFSNDLSLLEKVPSVDIPLAITEAKLNPAGIKYFVRSVPAHYRVYFKDVRVSDTFKEEMIDYIERHEGIEGSKTLMMWLHRKQYWASWCSRSFYLNYTHESQLTMLYLLFSEVLGKNYKLEQK